MAQVLNWAVLPCSACRLCTKEGELPSRSLENLRHDRRAKKLSEEVSVFGFELARALLAMQQQAACQTPEAAMPAASTTFCFSLERHSPTTRRQLIAPGTYQRRNCADRCYRTQAGRDKAASLGSEENNVVKKWVAKFVPDNEDSESEQLWKRNAPADNSEAVLLAKEKFWGRIAVLGLGAVLLSERLSGRGIVAALNMATGVPYWEIEPALGLLVGGLLAAGTYPIIKRALNRANSTAPKAVLKEVVLTVGDNFQVATGRLACLALAGTILAEATTGKGILALLNIKTGVEITEIEAGLTFLLLLLFTEDVKSKDSE